MPYSQYTWVDDDGSGTVGSDVTAARMNNIEQGIEDNDNNKQPLSTDLSAIAALTSGANKFPYATGSGTWALADITAFGRSLIDDADATAGRATLVAAGTGVANTFSGGAQTISFGGGKTTLALTDTGTANVGITFGGDTNIYRSAAALLSSDHSFQALGYIGATNSFRAGSVASQSSKSGGTVPLVAAILRGNDIEFGYDDTAGYHSTIGAEATSKKSYLAFNAEWASGDLYTTRGIRGSIYRGDLAGGFEWGNVAKASSTNQPFVTLMSLSSAGVLSLATQKMIGLASGTTSGDALHYGQIGAQVQGYDTDLAAIAALTSAADKGLYATGSGTWALYDLTSTARSVLDDSSTSAMRTTLGVAIGSNVQAWDADLDAIAALTSAADKVPYSTGTATWALATLTAFGRSLIDDADAAAGRATLGWPDDSWHYVNAAGEPVFQVGWRNYSNLMTNNSAEVSATANGWAAGTSSWYFNTGATLTRETSIVYSWAGSFKTVTTAASAFQGSACTINRAWTSGVAVTFTVWAKISSGTKDVQLFAGRPSADSNSATASLTTTFQKFSVTWTPSATATNDAMFGMRTLGADAITFYMDECEVYEPANAAAGNYERLRYKKASGIVYVQGMPIGTTNGAGAFATLFNLPAGYRPSGTIPFATRESLSTTAIDVTAAGDVRVYALANPASNVAVDFSFPADQ